MAVTNAHNGHGDRVQPAGNKVCRGESCNDALIRDDADLLQWLHRDRHGASLGKPQKA